MRLILLMLALLALKTNLALGNTVIEESDAQERMKELTDEADIFQVDTLDDWFKLNEQIIETSWIKHNHICVWRICSRPFKTLKPEIKVKSKSAKETKAESKIASKVKDMLKVNGRPLPGIRITQM